MQVRLVLQLKHYISTLHISFLLFFNTFISLFLLFYQPLPIHKASIFI